jgi:hypothetical protein
MRRFVSSSMESRMSARRPVRSYSIAAALLTALAVASVVACAQGTNGADDDDDDVRVDARRVDARPADARPPTDARLADARAPDASIGVDGGLPGLDGGGLPGMCATSAECTVVGECCFSFPPGSPGFCVPGEEMFGICLPN